MIRSLELRNEGKFWTATAMIDRYVVTVKYNTEPDLAKVKGDLYRVIEGNRSR